MDKNVVALELKKAADEWGAVDVLSLFLPNAHIRLPMTEKMCEMPVGEIEFSQRSKNGIMRSGIRTIGELCDVAMSEKGLNAIRNIGEKSIREIITKLFLLLYEDLNDNEKHGFWLNVLQHLN